MTRQQERTPEASSEHATDRPRHELVNQQDQRAKKEGQQGDTDGVRDSTSLTQQGEKRLTQKSDDSQQGGGVHGR